VNTFKGIAEGFEYQGPVRMQRAPRFARALTGAKQTRSRAVFRLADKQQIHESNKEKTARGRWLAQEATVLLWLVSAMDPGRSGAQAM